MAGFPNGNSESAADRNSASIDSPLPVVRDEVDRSNCQKDGLDLTVHSYAAFGDFSDRDIYVEESTDEYPDYFVCDSDFDDWSDEDDTDYDSPYWRLTEQERDWVNQEFYGNGDRDDCELMTEVDYREAWDMSQLYFEWIVEPHSLETDLPLYGSKDPNLCPIDFSLKEWRLDKLAFRQRRPHCENRHNTLKQRTRRRFRKMAQAERDFLLSDTSHLYD